MERPLVNFSSTTNQSAYTSMLKLFQWLFLGHAHKWVVERETQLDMIRLSGYRVENVGTRVRYSCEICKDIKIKDIR